MNKLTSFWQKGLATAGAILDKPIPEEEKRLLKRPLPKNTLAPSFAWAKKRLGRGRQSWRSLTLLAEELLNHGGVGQLPFFALPAAAPLALLCFALILLTYTFFGYSFAVLVPNTFSLPKIVLWCYIRGKEALRVVQMLLARLQRLKKALKWLLKFLLQLMWNPGAVGQKEQTFCYLSCIASKHPSVQSA